MSSQDKRIPEDFAPEVLELASRYYADHTQSYSASELVVAGKEVDIKKNAPRAVKQCGMNTIILDI
jgi:hypothetical protein